MNYKELLYEKNQDVRERFQLAGERLSEIAEGEASEMEEPLKEYFKKAALHLVNCQKLYAKIENENMDTAGLLELQMENESYYEELLVENYDHSYANPDFAQELFAKDYAKLLCFLYAELFSGRVYCFEQDLLKLTILMELVLEIYGKFSSETVSYKQLRDTIYWFLYDYADEFCGWRVRELLDSRLTFATDIIMESDLNDIRYLYRYGEYITENEIRISRYLSSLSQKEIDEIASTYTQGYCRGFEIKGVDLSKKNTVNLRYHIGFERVIRAAIQQFKEIGLDPVIYRSASNTLNRRQNIKIGYVSTSVNEQFDYDHRFDSALYLDKRMVDRKIECMRHVYKEYQEEAAGFSGPACFDVFGQKPFLPVRKESACKLNERQQTLNSEYSFLSNELMNEFIDQNERSFTMISYPVPEIGDQFEEIFREMKHVNTLDNALYCRIQDKMIHVLDQASSVRIMGRRNNITNLIISFQDVQDLKTETKFENCLADVNIPVGEVFTSPKLKKTTGLFHVGEAYIGDILYKNLKIHFEDGMVTDYSCENFATEAEGKELIREEILYHRDSLPMGEFAIGTNTVAYVMAQKFGIMDKLPILVTEKMGPHIALGDTCYAYQEDVPVHNPDGREMIAKENECSALRKEEPVKAYFNCHTDIVIPYEEIGELTAIMPDHYEVPIIIDGRFILDGTMELNDAFMSDAEKETS